MNITATKNPVKNISNRKNNCAFCANRKNSIKFYGNAKKHREHLTDHVHLCYPTRNYFNPRADICFLEQDFPVDRYISGHAEKGMSKYLCWRRELPEGARQCRQLLKVLPEQPDQGRDACVSPDGRSPLSRSFYAESDGVENAGYCMNESGRRGGNESGTAKFSLRLLAVGDEGLCYKRNVC